MKTYEQHVKTYEKHAKTDEKPIKTGSAPGIPPNTVPKGDDLFKNRV